MGHGFVKIYGDKLITSSLWDEPPEARLVFLAMLAIADARGYVDIPNERALARVLNLPDDYVAKALGVLMAPDTGSRSPDHDGMRLLREGSGWLCVNYEKYREYRSPAQEATRQRVAKHRARVTGNDVTTEAEADLGRPPLDPMRSGSGTATVVPVTPERRNESSLWPAGTWLARFGVAWTARYHLTHGGGLSTSKACGAFSDVLASLPASERLDAQARAGALLQAFFDDPSADKAKHPFAWFVERFDTLRARPQKRENRSEAPRHCAFHMAKGTARRLPPQGAIKGCPTCDENSAARGTRTAEPEQPTAGDFLAVAGRATPNR
jgi:hypothetical protein